MKNLTNLITFSKYKKKIIYIFQIMFPEEDEEPSVSMYILLLVVMKTIGGPFEIIISCHNNKHLC